MHITEEDFAKMIVALSEVPSRIRRVAWQYFITGVGVLFLGMGAREGDADVEIDDTTASASRA